MQARKKIIGVDPGYGRLGVAVIEKNSDNFDVIFSSCVETNKDQGFDQRLYFVCKKLEYIVETEKPDVLVVENLFVNKNQKTISGVYQTRGAIIYIAKKAGIPVVEISPQQVKISVTGYGKSEKSAVERMVRTILKLSKTKKYLDDEIDALAIAYSGFFY